MSGGYLHGPRWKAYCKRRHELHKAEGEKLEFGKHAI